RCKNKKTLMVYNNAPVMQSHLIAILHKLVPLSVAAKILFQTIYEAAISIKYIERVMFDTEK
ncbi:TPA: hypothetical protein ACHLEV_004650, partial [Escherichia coli]